MVKIAETESQGPKRPRRLSVVSNFIRRIDIETAFDRRNVIRYAGIVHDKDPDTATHAHAFVELKDGRTVDQVKDYFDKPAIVKPLVGKSGDTGSFARAVRYLTHEHQSQQDLGKYLYPDAEVFASEGFDWRAEVNALTARESNATTPNVRQIRLDVMQGRMTARDVRERYPNVYLDRMLDLHRLEGDFKDFRQQKVYEQVRRDQAAGLPIDYAMFG
ncbi:hypothetical protein [Homoserinimonas sp. A520]